MYRRITLNGLNKLNFVKNSKRFYSDDEIVDTIKWPKKIFSGIQPTGSLHIGNYFGAVQKWVKLQDTDDDVSYCIVDLHSITLPQDPSTLKYNIFKLTATMLACGIDPSKSTLFVQSTIKQHSELNWILGCLCTMARLSHLPQYKEKTKTLRDIPLGLFVYPVLQAADILLYKATHVPVGEDQIQHIQLAQHLAKIFNYKFGTTFPHCHAIYDDKNNAGRIKSLRDPLKKMSKSDTDPKSYVNLIDEPDIILEKIKKSITDFTSKITFDPINRPGVSNLIIIHSLITGKTPDEICLEADKLNLDTGKYKLYLADCLITHLKPIREKYNDYMKNLDYLIYILEIGREKSSEVAERTINEVKDKIGLGITNTKFSISDKLVNEL